MSENKKIYNKKGNHWDEQSDSLYKRSQRNRNRKRKRRKRRIIKRCLLAFLILCSFFVVVIGTPLGKNMLYRTLSSYVYGSLRHEKDSVEAMNPDPKSEFAGRKEKGVSNILLFGIEEIGGARNTDSMMIASIHSNKKTIKLVSLMRDTYVSVPGWKSTKLNAAYSKGGADLLLRTIEENYQIAIDGYASVNFESFEKIVDSIGGVTLELGKEEAEYLRKTNYISNPEYRTVQEGINNMNGNQLLGYCRVRKVKTAGGSNNDYGRTVRQRRAMSAIIEKVKSQNIFKTAKQAKEWMGFVTTNMSRDQIEDIIRTVMEQSITTVDNMRLPVDGMFDDPKSYNKTTYPLVLDWEKNIAELYKFLYE